MIRFNKRYMYSHGYQAFCMCLKGRSSQCNIPWQKLKHCKTTTKNCASVVLAESTGLCWNKYETTFTQTLSGHAMAAIRSPLVSLLDRWRLLLQPFRPERRNQRILSHRQLESIGGKIENVMISRARGTICFWMFGVEKNLWLFVIC